MIKKKFFATVTAAAMMTSLFSMTAFAGTTDPAWGANGGKQEQTGSGVAPEVVVEVSLPEDLTFILNPFRLDVDEDGTKDEQIWTQEYAITNLSAIPVKVNVSTVVEGKNNTTVTDSPAFDTNTGELLGTSKAKTVALTQAFAQTVAFTEADGFKYTFTNKKVSDNDMKNAATAKAEAAFILNATAQEADFLLRGAAETGLATADVIKCSTAFKFIGAIDPDTNDPYVSDDVSVKCTYTMNYLTNNMFDSYATAGTKLTGAANHMEQ